MREARVIDLGGEFAKDGTLVAVDNLGKEWLVSKENGSVRIFFNECPHQGQPLKASNSKFICTGHNWAFGGDGENFVKNGQCLKEFKDFHMSADKCFINWNQAPREKTGGDIPEDLSLTFYSHACLGISANSFTLLTDPWIESSTYDGNWVHWPTTREIENVNPNVIVITHEHPDHFHEKSLLRFSSDTLIIVPNYLNRNLFQKVKNLGFNNVISLNYNDSYQLVEGVRIRFLRPSSKWEDAILDLDLFGFKWLNVNDAGYVSSEELLSSNYHLLTATFDVFASDYPMMWESINERKKVQHIQASKKSALSHIVRLSTLANSQYFLPFASFWRLNPIKFTDLELKMSHLTLNEIHEYFQKNESGSEVLDLLPGESYSFSQNKLISERPDREIIKSGDYPAEPIEIDSIVNCDGSLCSGIVETTRVFLQEISSYSQFFRTEDVILEVICECRNLIAKQFFGDNPSSPDVCAIQVQLPYSQLINFIQNGYSFEALRIGYWVQFARDKNIYTPNFFRLLAFGSNTKFIETSQSKKVDQQVDDIPISEILDLNLDSFNRIFNRAGLPCISCKHLQQESLGDAMEIHHLTKQDKDFLRAEVAWVLGLKK